MKIREIIKNILTWLLVLTAVAMMLFTIVSVTFFDKTERNLFGYKAFIVLSDSMSATDFDAGDLVIVKKVDPSLLKEGDIIAYQSTNDYNYGKVVTHKIRSCVVDEYGNPGFVTYGTSTDTDDESIVTYSYVVGKYQFSIPKLGLFFRFLQTGPGYVACLFVPFGILILVQGLNSVRLFRQYRKEQLQEIEEKKASELAELKEECDRLEKERLRMEEMVWQLSQMQEMLMKDKPEISILPKSSEQISEEKHINFDEFDINLDDDDFDYAGMNDTEQNLSDDVQFMESQDSYDDAVEIIDLDDDKYQL